MTAEASAEHKPGDWDGPCPCQLSETHCALCHRDLATILDDKFIESIWVPAAGGRLRRCELWACAPNCMTAIPRKTP